MLSARLGGDFSETAVEARQAIADFRRHSSRRKRLAACFLMGMYG
jgi:hypothetical protein